MSIYTGACNGHQPSATTSLSFGEVYARLTDTRPFPVLPNASLYSHEPELSHAITELHLHPCLEALLHILNNDLPAAHFLCRHMENRPAYEAMYIHGILHRVEGDYRNAEVWYSDVTESECFDAVWPARLGGPEAAMRFIRDVENLLKEKTGSLDNLQSESRREIEALFDWCKKRFGLDKVDDATKVWVDKPQKTKEMASKMLVGGEGWRQF